MTSQVLVSIIIPVREINDFIFEALPFYEKLAWQNFEILIFPDFLPKKKYTWPKTKIIASGKVGPAEKRDLAIKYAKGQVFAFIDDDAFPSRQWLVAALAHFTDSQVAGVGGPGVTPLNASLMEKISGWVSASPLGAGPYTYRFLPGKKQVIDDFPSMNLLVRASDFKKVGGFDSHYYPGEDTKLCLDLVNLGKKLIYEPKALVFHHRRPLWLPHLKQNGNYGLHRGFFARVLPQTSARPIYFFPSLMVGNTVLALVSFWLSPAIFQLSLLPLFFYLLLLGCNAVWVFVKSRSVLIALLAIPAVFMTHFWYGIRFLQGFFLTKELVR